MIKPYLHHPLAWLFILSFLLINTLIFGYFHRSPVSLALTVTDDSLSLNGDNRDFYKEVPAEYIEKMYYLRRLDLTEVPIRMVRHACEQAYSGDFTRPAQNSEPENLNITNCQKALLGDLELGIEN